MPATESTVQVGCNFKDVKSNGLCVLIQVTQKGSPHSVRVQYGGDKRPDQTQAYEHWPPRKIDVTRKLTVVSISVVTLIRTDTTLDHSQKAEKV